MSGFDMNNVNLSGNLTRDPELRSTNSGTSVCKLGIAWNKRIKNNSTGEWDEQAHYFDITLWSGMAEWAANNLSKGDKVVISGELRWRQWEVEGGGKRSAVDINAFTLIPVGRRDGSGGGNGGGQEQPVAAPTPGDPLSGTTGPPPGGNTPPPAEDDIPF